VELTARGALAPAGWFRGAVESPRKRFARRPTCSSRLTAIGTALRNYQGDYGAFPPAYVDSVDGERRTSWRVLILPYLGYDDLYRSYTQSESWDSPKNRHVISRMPAEFACPADARSNGNGLTNYVLITGKGTVYENPTLPELPVGVGMSEAIVATETVQGIPWTKPLDMTVETLEPHLGVPTSENISSYHGYGAEVLWCDGTTRFLPSDISESEVRVLLSGDHTERRSILEKYHYFVP
jgi:hypothetical protein